jgi:uncharacterized BrkB/YihY/UPF0761 family membrane protein
MAAGNPAKILPSISGFLTESFISEVEEGKGLRRGGGVAFVKIISIAPYLLVVQNLRHVPGTELIQ